MINFLLCHILVNDIFRMKLYLANVLVSDSVVFRRAEVVAIFLDVSRAIGKRLRARRSGALRDRLLVVHNGVFILLVVRLRVRLGSLELNIGLVLASVVDLESGVVSHEVLEFWLAQGLDVEIEGEALAHVIRHLRQRYAALDSVQHPF